MTAPASATAARETLLLGPGPSNLPEAVRAALAQPLVGHLDPRFLATMERVKASLRRCFGTANPVTFPVSGTGSAGMEAIFANLVEAGDRIVVGVNGVFGQRIAKLVERYGAVVTRVEAPWGRAVPIDDLAQAARSVRPKIIAVIHGETSTGVRQPLDGLGDLARETGSLLVIDTVTSLGAMPLDLDRQGVDAAYSGTQKCLNVPPGLAPVTFSARAVEIVHARRTPVPSFYLDLREVLAYLGEGTTRAYHHTAPITLVNALAAGLDLVLAEGLEARAERHRRAQDHLITRLGDLGLPPLVPEAERLWPLTTLRLPKGLDEAAIRRDLLDQHDVEIGGGLGPLAGSVWRIGLMGVNARVEVVDRLVDLLGPRLRT